MTVNCTDSDQSGGSKLAWLSVAPYPEKEPPRMKSPEQAGDHPLPALEENDGTGSASVSRQSLQRSYTADLKEKRRDTFKSLSIDQEASAPGGEDTDSVGHEHHSMPQLPLALLMFVCTLASIAGAIAAGFHLLTLYTGCLLEINNCDKKHGFYDNPVSLLKASVDVLPKELVYILMAAGTHFLMGICFKFLDEESVWQCLGGGTMQSLVAVASGYPIHMRSAVFRIAICALYFCGGGTLGGEGPAIHICTAMATSIGWAFGIQAPRTQSLLGSLGFCCGFSSSFNAPLTGILFALEELQHVYTGGEQSQVEVWMFLLSSVAAVLVRRALKGNTPMIKVDISNDDGLLGEHLWMLIAIPIGVVCAFVGYATNRVFGFWHRKVVQRLKECVPTVILFPFFGAAVASLGALVYLATDLPGIWGIGIESLQKVFDKELRWHDYILFAIGKLFAMVLSITMGFPGDMLEPVLIAGGFIGGLFGSMLPQDVVGEEAVPTCAMLGMVALFSSCFRFPLTSVFIVIELTGLKTYDVILPTALASFTALIASNKLCFDPLLEQLLQHSGIDLNALAKLATEESQGMMGGGEEILETDAGISGIHEVNQLTPQGSEGTEIWDMNKGSQALANIFSPLAQSLASASSGQNGRRISSLGEIHQLSQLLHSAPHGPLSAVMQSDGSSSDGSASKRGSIASSSFASPPSRRVSVASNFSRSSQFSRTSTFSEAIRRGSVMSSNSSASRVSNRHSSEDEAGNHDKKKGLLRLPGRLVSADRGSGRRGSSKQSNSNSPVEPIREGINIISEEDDEEDEGTTLSVVPMTRSDS